MKSLNNLYIFRSKALSIILGGIILTFTELSFSGLTYSSFNYHQIDGNVTHRVDRNYANIPTVTKEYSVDNFHKLSIHVPVDVYYKTGKPSIKIQAQPHVQDELDVSVENNMLMVRSVNGFKAYKPVNIYISSPQLDFLNLQGVLKVNALGIASKNFILKNNSSAEVYISGLSQHCEVQTQGLLKLNMEKLICQNTHINAGGSGSIRAYAKESINGRILGVMNIVVLGSPSRRDIQASGIVDIAYR